MIVFDLACAGGHVFEAWFGSTADYDAQRARGLVACPVCGSEEVAKAVMAPAVGAKGNTLPAAAAPPDRPVPMRAGPPLPAEMKAMLTALAQAQAKALSGSEHVGARFAAEARAIHDGDAPERTIHGQATMAEARDLADDGIAVLPLLLPVVRREDVQ